MAHKHQPAEPLFARIAALAVGVWRRRMQKSPKTGAPTDAAVVAIDHMKPRAFERLIGEAFRSQGYLIVATGDGVPMTLRKERETVLVLCKHWKTDKVGIEVVRDLQAAMQKNGAAGGFVVTSGRFSREAQAFASSINVKLIDSEVLQGLLAKSRPAH